MPIPSINFSPTQVNNIYNILEEVAEQSYQNTDASETVNNLAQAINDITAEYNIIQNQLSLANNVNQENLIKRSQLL